MVYTTTYYAIMDPGMTGPTCCGDLCWVLHLGLPRYADTAFHMQHRTWITWYGLDPLYTILHALLLYGLQA